MRLKLIREAITDFITAENSSISVYPTFPGVVQVPGVVVMPAPANTASFDNGGFGASAVSWTLEIYCLAPYTESSTSQDALDELIDPAIPDSVTAILRDNPSLGGAVQMLHVINISQYGGKFQDSGVQHIGAIITVVVMVC